MYRDDEWYETQLGIKVLMRESPSGVTALSKECFLKNRELLASDLQGGIKVVYLVYVTYPSWDFLTYVVDVFGKALCLNGFAWGYGGEGSVGLKWLFEQLKFSPLRGLMPPPNKPGAWTVTRSGLVHPS